MTDDDFDNEQEWIARGFMRRGQPARFDTIAAPTRASSRFLVDWIDLHREATHPPDPTYPHGCEIDVALDAAHACRLELPCPAAGCGRYVVKCRACGFAITLATAGRADDPRSVRMPCKPH